MHMWQPYLEIWSAVQTTCQNAILRSILSQQQFIFVFAFRSIQIFVTENGTWTSKNPITGKGPRESRQDEKTSWTQCK